MKQYLTSFPTHEAYEQFAETDLIKPNVSLMLDDGGVSFSDDNGMRNYYMKSEVNSMIGSVRKNASGTNITQTTTLATLSGYASTFASKTIPTKTSQVSNDMGYLTTSDVSVYLTGVTESDPTVKAWAKTTNKPTYNASEVGAMSAATTLDDVSDGSSRKLSTLVVKDGSKVLTTNDYTTAEKNKLGSIASSAQINVIETVKVNNSNLSPSSKAVNVTVPTKISQVTNDSDFITTASTKNFTTSAITKTQIEGYGYTNKTGTITGVQMNNTSKGTSGVANLGTVVQSLSINGSAATISNGAASMNINLPQGLPSVTASDNGKTLKVVNGVWAAS